MQQPRSWSGASQSKGTPAPKIVANFRKQNLPEKGKFAGFNSLGLYGEVIFTESDQFEALLFKGISPEKRSVVG